MWQFMLFILPQFFKLTGLIRSRLIRKSRLSFTIKKKIHPSISWHGSILCQMDSLTVLIKSETEGATHYFHKTKNLSAPYVISHKQETLTGTWKHKLENLRQWHWHIITLPTVRIMQLQFKLQPARGYPWLSTVDTVFKRNKLKHSCLRYSIHAPLLVKNSQTACIIYRIFSNLIHTLFTVSEG